MYFKETAIGWGFVPVQIVRVAKANAKADKIKAQAKIEIFEMDRPVLNRVAHEERQHHENIGNIMTKAIPEIVEDAEPEKLEKDWLTYFFNQSRLVTDSEMQTL